ncbi:MAG: LLM class flavin-dependent oxidoreductase [Alphaproteobacteria bacterium]|nr:LLM class flavin-dependent oxidoreductase [Alphaproteobacteria bacterium]
MMQFGVFDHLDRQAGVPPQRTYEDRLRLIADYDAAGISMYHLAEHHATPLGLAPSPSVFLSAVAQRTTNIHFGPMVYCLPLYEPLRLIEEISMIDQMSGGRFEFGIGRGISPFEVAYFGIDKENAGPIYLEALQVLKRGLSSDTLNFVGEHFCYEDVPMVISPVTLPHPPIWYGIATPNGAAWPATQKINVISNAPCEITRSATDQYRETWAREHGGPVTTKIGVARHVFVADSQDEADRISGRAYAAWYENFISLWRKFGVENPVYASTLATARERDAIIAGTPDTVASEIERQIGLAGLNYFVCRFAYGDLHHDEASNSFALFAKEVMPRFVG